MPDYRKPTPKQEQDLERARQLRQRAFTGQQDFLDRISTSASKQTRDDLKEADRLSNAVPASVKEYEAYKYSGHKKGGTVKKRVRRYAEGGDIENYEDAPAPKVERIGKSALEEGEEIFKAEKAKRSKHTSATPSRKVTDYGDETSRMMSRAPARTPVRDAGTVPVGADEAAPRMDMRPQARQPSTAERMLEAFPAGAAGIAGGAALGRMMAARKFAQDVEAGKAAARARSADALRRSTEARSAARSAAKEAEAGKESARMAEEGGMRYGRGAPQPRKADEAQRKAFVGRSGDGYKKGGVVSASRRGDGIAQRGKTRGKLVK